jgi:hypothetical protein
MDQLYRDDDIPREQARDLLVRRLATLAGIAREREIPVVLTRSSEDELSEPLVAAARETLTCEATKFGPRFTDAEAEDETLVYHLGDGWMQTTLAFWQEILQHRARAAGALVDEDGPAADAPGNVPSPPTPVTPEGW